MSESCSGRSFRQSFSWNLHSSIIRGSIPSGYMTFSFRVDSSAAGGVLGRGVFLQSDLGIDRQLGAQLLDDTDPILREQRRVVRMIAGIEQRLLRIGELQAGTEIVLADIFE